MTMIDGGITGGDLAATKIDELTTTVKEMRETVIQQVALLKDINGDLLQRIAELDQSARLPESCTAKSGSFSNHHFEHSKIAVFGCGHWYKYHRNSQA